TRFSRDWSSDVCSSDLASAELGIGDSKNGGEFVIANLGAGAELAAERQFTLRVTRVAGSERRLVEQELGFTRSIALAAGFGVGGAASAKLGVELAHGSEIDG